MLFIPIVLVIAVFVTIGTSIRSTLREIASKDRHCDNAWQTLELQFTRRNALVQDLTQVVGRYASEEAETLRSITNASAAISQAGTPETKMEASAQLTSAIYGLLESTEKYPQLNASKEFQELRDDLLDVEHKIAHARMSYNERVHEYNDAIATFPGSMIATSRYRARKSFEEIGGPLSQIPPVKC